MYLPIVVANNNKEDEPNFYNGDNSDEHYDDDISEVSDTLSGKR